jgi:hypothetical protein
MTEQQLQVLSGQAMVDHAEADGDCSGCFGWTTSALGLIGEVRKLQAALKVAVREMERAEFVGEVKFKTNALASGVAIGLEEALFTAREALK